MIVLFNISICSLVNVISLSIAALVFHDMFPLSRVFNSNLLISSSSKLIFLIICSTDIISIKLPCLIAVLII
nr:MAG TPA: hypothetical protein [Caudoviricetes sp.]